MIVDSSALVAIVSGEPERQRFLEAVARADRVLLSAAGYLETAIVLDGRGNAALSEAFDAVLRELGVEVVDVTAEQAVLARAAYRQFGKGTGHPARLNFGDCLAYALAVSRDEELLFKGEDFGHTDVRVPLRPETRRG